MATKQMTRQDQIQDEIHAAQRALSHHVGCGMDAVITANTTRHTRKEFFGFHFEPSGTVKPGDVLTREDGTRQTVEAVLS